jgi:hypothetical protein
MEAKRRNLFHAIIRTPREIEKDIPHCLQVFLYCGFTQQATEENFSKQQMQKPQSDWSIGAENSIGIEINGS